MDKIVNYSFHYPDYPRLSLLISVLGFLSGLLPSPFLPLMRSLPVTFTLEWEMQGQLKRVSNLTWMITVRKQSHFRSAQRFQTDSWHEKNLCPPHFFFKLRRWPSIPLSSPLPPSLSYADVLPVQRWFCNYWWLHISSELLQSVDMVIVKEVICIKLIIRRNKAHKSAHYQFSGKCFKLTLLCWVQGKRKKRGKDSLILPNQGSNLSERTKLCLTQWIH